MRSPSSGGRGDAGALAGCRRGLRSGARCLSGRGRRVVAAGPGSPRPGSALPVPAEGAARPAPAPRTAPAAGAAAPPRRRWRRRWARLPPRPARLSRRLFLSASSPAPRPPPPAIFAQERQGGGDFPETSRGNSSGASGAAAKVFDRGARLSALLPRAPPAPSPAPAPPAGSSR